MKKLPLACAVLSFFAVSHSSAQEFNQDFRVSLNIPSSINVSAFKQETIALDFEEAQKKSGALIGSMAIKTTSNRCDATITTDNGFKLVGPKEGGVKLPYILDYMAKDRLYGEIVTTPFSAKTIARQRIGCGEGDLKLRLIGIAPEDMTNGMVTGAYNDVIHVEVKTGY